MATNRGRNRSERGVEIARMEASVTEVGRGLCRPSKFETPGPITSMREGNKTAWKARHLRGSRAG